MTDPETEKFAIRLARGEDRDAVDALLAEVEAIHVAALPWRFRTPAGVAAREQGNVRALLGGGALFVAEEAGAIVGVIRLSALEVPPSPSLMPRRYVFVEELVVAAHRRRRGIGRALMAQAQRWAAAQGIDQIELDVFEFNREAIALYESLGYETIQRRMGRRRT